jgi:hypothetical protein
MPKRQANNAVVEAFDGTSKAVYSFAGIDSTKLYTGINLKSFKYQVTTNSWTNLPTLPDTLGKVAAGASVVKNKIYIMGGYHVFENGNEISSNKNHVFNPLTNSFEADGANIPVSIDDHVQAVWRDSLIYLISGWSNTGNVANVQIYNPALNSWHVGSSVPNTTSFKAFGASGTVVGDTIYYNGGVKSGAQFVNVPFLRKGIINPLDPSQITWFQEQNNPGASGYRMAATSYKNYAIWIGGGDVAYNYNGIGYYGTGGVSPMDRILSYETISKSWIENLSEPESVMDLRGIAKIDSNTWIIAGGMGLNQAVSNYTYQIKLENISANIKTKNSSKFHIVPNPFKNEIEIIHEKDNQQFKIYTVAGELIHEGRTQYSEKIDLSSLKNGFYFLHVNQSVSKIVKQ